MKTALITGSARRIGRAISLALAAEGWDLYLHYRNSKPEIETLAEEVRSLGRRVAIVQADLEDSAAASSLIEQQCRALGPLSCLINNAALYEKDALADFSSAGFDRQMAVNLRAPLLLSQAFMHQMPADGRGVIINLLDFRALAPTKNFFTYTISKAALASFTKMAAITFAPRIRVCGIAPGLVLPSQHEKGELFETLKNQTPLGGAVDIEDIVSAIRYLLSVNSVTGQILTLDKGQRFGTYPTS